MLGRLISDILRRKRAPASPVVAAVERQVSLPPASPLPSAAAPVAKHVDPPADAATLRRALKGAASRLPMPSTAEEAQDALRELLVPTLSACVPANDGVLACDIEELAYGRLINVFEDPGHYEICFGLMDPALRQLGRSSRAAGSPVAPASGDARRVLFFLHNLESNMAHIVLLCDLIDAYLVGHPDDALNLGLIGSTQGQLSKRVRELQQRWGGIHVSEIRNPNSHAAAYQKAAETLRIQGFDRLVVVGAPLGISFLTGLLGPVRLGWLSMKFELSCFEQLLHRCSFASGFRREREIDGRRWLEAPPFFTEEVRLAPSSELPAVLVAARRFGTIFYTINREQKIRNPAFLEAVAQILDQVPDSCFVWTGRKKLGEIDDFFSQRGLAQRHFFAGWVVPDDLMSCGDVFLDTPVLSGTVAARAVACGRPVVTWAGSHSWVNFFVESPANGTAAELRALSLELEKSGLGWESATEAQYVEQAVRLAFEAGLRKFYGEALRTFARIHFFDGSRSAEAHFLNLRSHVEAGAFAESNQLAGLRVEWVVDQVFGSRELGWRSDHASVRYRALLPAQALGNAGAVVNVLRNADWHWASPGSTDLRTDVVVVGKIFVDANIARFERESRNVLTQVAAARQSGALVVADFVDDHFDRPDVGTTWRMLANSVSACVASTETMAARVRQFTPAPVFIVGDPLASPRGTPRVFRVEADAQPAKVLKLVWYGHRSNTASLLPWIDMLVSLADEQPFRLTLITEQLPAITEFVRTFNETHDGKARLNFVPWTEKAQWQAVDDSDVVLIPSDSQDSRKAVKSPNRLTDALHAGRYVIASPLPAYVPFARFASLTEAPLEALRWYLAHPAEALAMIEAGQAAAEAACGLDVIVRQWERVFRSGASPASRVEAVAVQHDSPPVRLNLGCGDKILSGYINVDVVEARAGKTPDVLCDLRNLTPFATDSADEIMSVHVVEHFWRWEVEDVLKEWVRVLKPGGRFVVECPNLQSACEAFLADPDARSAADKQGQTTMWVFYGDPQWKDPLMVHRWGYTPDSLGKLLRSVGLVDVRQEPAQYKLREPRDMRVVGFKPRR